MINVLWIFLAGGISLFFFYEYNRVKKAKRDERREQIKENRQELLDKTLKSKK